jgi:DNA polymerase V
MEFEFYVPELLTGKFSPLVLSPIPAGHPQSVEGTLEPLDLNDYVSAGRSEDIFYIDVQGESMLEYGIHEGDLLVASRSRQPKNGDVVVAEINGCFTIKRFVRWEKQLFLVPESEKFKTRRVEEHEHFAVWGVVTHVVHKFL